MSCMKKDYYLILGLTPEATAEEIRSAYRRLAIELHPDLSGFGSDQFLELQEAYSVLSDPMRRAVYDREAEEIPVRRTDVARPAESVIARRHSAEPLTPVQPVGEFEEISFLRSFETFLPSFSEMFDRLWSNFELVARPKAERLESLTVDVPLSPKLAPYPILVGTAITGLLISPAITLGKAPSIPATTITTEQGSISSWAAMVR